MTSASQDYLRVEGVTKRFGTFTALDNVSFGAKKGEFISILGPSGCGKTTMLRAVAGLERQDEGRVLLSGQDVSHLPVSKRHVGIVFQSYALFPNLSARSNIAYGLKRSMKSRSAVNERVDELLKLVGLKGLGSKYPGQLSGGQQQRVALARAMALSPNLLLLDEPLSALDAQVRVMLRTEIRAMTQRLGLTTIMVTHDQEEALTMADRILVMKDGELVQNGTPSEIYDEPESPFVASFIGSMNFIRGSYNRDTGTFSKGSVRVRVDRQARSLKGEVLAAIRPEDVLVSTNGEQGPNVFEVDVRNVEYRGPIYRLALDLPLGHTETAPLIAEMPAEKVRRLNMTSDSRVKVILPSERVRLFHAEQV
ncbi:putative 2-aminoethylphosphonate ABC transporter ATP-binding protein [Salidesulfovibrio brasiliensis]|uniref:putative 2-aminoethylphosphonate ABC transporter ATP-binding protein n=1 Tax=Salidesulfovibrio brasiliensis TaxID=221711 RepID=UPI0006D02C99|nr:putative 2-aminoethylphosphonate ABC transporter ATP-binding protein [Salidesulfovibrio brasiliensis]